VDNKLSASEVEKVTRILGENLLCFR